MARSNALESMSDADLVAALDEAKDDLLNLRFQNVTGQLDNNARLGQVRRHVARLMTELREREIEAAEAVEHEEIS
ncbi:MAG: 50S ribosomal protein L29 [Acidimicrobiales bacterium]